MPMHQVFWQVPWPSWIGTPEPMFLRRLPGGCVTAMTVVIMVIVLVLQIVKAVARCCRKKKEILRHEFLARDIGFRGGLRDCYGPKICIVLDQEEECRGDIECCTPFLKKSSPLRESLRSWLHSPDHVTCVPLEFREGSPLYKREVWVVGISKEEIGTCAELYTKRMRVDPEFILKQFQYYSHSQRRWRCSSISRLATTVGGASSPGSHEEGTPWFRKQANAVEYNRVMDRVRDPTGKFALYLPYTKKHADEHMYLQENGHDFEFAPSDIIAMIMAVLGHATDEHAVPVFLGAYEVGEVEAVFPVIDTMKDRQEYRKTLGGWKTIFFWRRPPLEEIARLFGPSAALYFSYMQCYAMALVVPLIAVVASFAYHMSHREVAKNLKWGAAFSEGWSQALFALLLSVWTTILFVLGRQKFTADSRRLGQGELHKEVYSIDNTKMYFRRRGFSVSKKKGVTLNKWFTLHDFWRVPKAVSNYLAIYLLLLTSCGVIAGLCFISDKAANVNYSDNKNVDFILKNLISVGSYLVISTPLQGIYDKLTRWVTFAENRKETSELVERLVRRRAFFQLVNYMGRFLYLGFWKQNITGLRYQLLTFFVVKPSGLVGTFVEMLSLLCHRHKDFEDHQIVEMVEHEWAKDEPSLFSQYLKVTTLFAAALIFAPIFPEGIVIAWLHTIFKYITDKVKLYRQVRVHIPHKTDFLSFTAWFEIWQYISWVAIFLSCWLVNVFTKTTALSEQTDTWDPDNLHWDSVLGGLPLAEQRMYVIVIIEHFLIITKAYVNIVVEERSTETSIHDGTVKRVLRAQRVIGSDEEE